MSNSHGLSHETHNKTHDRSREAHEMQGRDEIMTCADVRKLLKMTPRAFQQLVTEGAGPAHFRVGKHIITGLRFKKMDVLRWIAEGGAYRNQAA